MKKYFSGLAAILLAAICYAAAKLPTLTPILENSVPEP
jgi:hypothetical protein